MMPITCKAAIADGKGDFYVDDIVVNPPKDDEVTALQRRALIA